MNLPLNEQQRRHLTVVLDHVDEALLEVIVGAASGEAIPRPERFLRPRDADVPAPIATAVRGAALELRTRLGVDIARLRLDVDSESVARRAAAYLAAAVVLLQDCHARSMRAYGDVDPRLAAELDPWLDRLEVDLTALRRAIESAAADPARRLPAPLPPP